MADHSSGSSGSENMDREDSSLQDGNSENGEYHEDSSLQDMNGDDHEDSNLQEGNGGDREPEEQQFSVNQEEKITGLVLLNETLLNEITSLRAFKNQMGDKIKRLEEELENNSFRTGTLLVEKNLLEDEKRKFEVAAASLAKEVATLNAEKTALLTEKQTAVANKESIESALSDSMAKIVRMTKELDDAQVAAATAQTEVHALNFEIEQLNLEKKKALKEITVLSTRKGENDEEFNKLISENKVLEEEVANLVNARAAAELQALDADKVIVELQEEISRLKGANGKLQSQLDEAQERIENLEEQHGLMAIRERDMTTQVQSLESDLHATNSGHQSISLALDQEKAAKGSLTKMLEMAYSKTRALEEDLNSVKSSLGRKEEDANGYQQRVLSLESEVSNLLQDNQALAKANSVLEEEVSRLNVASGDAAREGKEKLAKLNEAVRKMELALDEAKEGSKLLSQKEFQLKLELQELKQLAVNKSKLVKLAVPLLVSSSALAMMGTLAFLRRAKHQ